MATIVWIENELRLADHAALHRAASLGEPVLPVFVMDDDTRSSGSGARSAFGDWADGAASRWWLHHSLVAFRAALAGHGIPLVVRRGPAARVLSEVARESGARRVYWNARYEPSRHARDLAVAAALRAEGIEVRLFAGALLHDPDGVRTESGTPFLVFTPFWKRLERELAVPAPLPEPEFGRAGRPTRVPDTVDVESLGLLPKIDWTGGIAAAWTPGERGARARLEAALRDVISRYGDRRNRPDLDGTSRLSPHLHFGEISPRQVWTAAREAVPEEADPFLRQLAWREFAAHLLRHHPELPVRPLRPAFESFPWSDDSALFDRWTRGLTGFPIVDAGMRELWHTGWMHNRVRMVVASFLTKDLLIPWTRGAEWFRDTLVDADLANNVFGWQWTAGCGADAQPFFRVFNPVLQGTRYDPDGAYVRRWVPELALLPTKVLHEPWRASTADLRAAGVAPGVTYPAPVVDHDRARNRALAAYASINVA